MDAVLAEFPPDAESEGDDAGDAPRVAIVGRPNVGKSTLVNRLLGEDRMIVFDAPGTTRDAIEVPFERYGRHYTLIDTAGVRRRGRCSNPSRSSRWSRRCRRSTARTSWSWWSTPPTVSPSRTRMSPATSSNAAARWSSRRTSGTASTRTRVRARSGRSSGSSASSPSPGPLRVGAGRQGTGPLMRSVDAAYGAAMAQLPTPRLTRTLIAAVEQQAPPRAGLMRPKLRYAHQGGRNPPRIVIHGNALDCRPGELQALSRGRVPQGLRPHRNADPHRISHRPEPLRAGIVPTAVGVRDGRSLRNALK